VANMPGKLIVCLVVDRKLFFAAFSQDADRFFGFILQYKISLKPEAVFSLLHTIGIGPGEIAFCEAEIMNRIKQVGFTGPVVSANADQFFRKIESAVRVVLKLKQ